MRRGTFASVGRLSGMTRTVVLSLCVSGCAMAAEPDRAFVVVDEAARAAGYGIEVEGIASPRAFPTSLFEGERAAIVGPGSIRDLPDAPFVVVTGETGEIVGFEASEVRPDLLFVRGDAAAVEALAAMLGADLSSRDDGGYLLLAPTVWETSSDLEDLEGIFETLPASETELPLRDRSALRSAALGDEGSILRTSILDAMPSEIGDLVGVYSTPGGTLLVDAAGGFTLCGGESSVSSGSVRYERGRVTLVDRQGTTSVLSIGNGGRELRGTDGTRFALVEGR
jgi:hypothetical protein